MNQSGSCKCINLNVILLLDVNLHFLKMPAGITNISADSTPDTVQLPSSIETTMNVESV